MTPPAVAPAPNFDRIAPLYRVLEYLTLGPLLARTRTHHLPRLLDRRRALILGDGDGRFTARLLAANPHLHAHAVDLSPAMLRLLRANAAAASPTAPARLRTTHADARAFHPPASCDLVVTHFFLDCLTAPELDALVARLAPALTPGGLWLVSEFRIPPGPLHWPARVLIRALYFAFRVLTGLRTTRLPDHATTLRLAGLKLTSTHHKLAGLLTTELWQKSEPSSSPHAYKPASVPRVAS